MSSDRRRKLIEKIDRLLRQMDEEELEEILRYIDNI